MSKKFYEINGTIIKLNKNYAKLFVNKKKSNKVISVNLSKNCKIIFNKFTRYSKLNIISKKIEKNKN